VNCCHLPALGCAKANVRAWSIIFGGVEEVGAAQRYRAFLLIEVNLPHAGGSCLYGVTPYESQFTSTHEGVKFSKPYSQIVLLFRF
jgi:hypothetical protein